MDVSVLGIDSARTAAAWSDWMRPTKSSSGGECGARRSSHTRACVVAIEACCGAHHMGRALARQAHAVRLMSPEYVRPYVKAQKNDDRDAEAIAEAATRLSMSTESTQKPFAGRQN